MISELDDTIRQILIKEGGISPVDIDVSFDAPDREWSAAIARPTINCYLFDIRENLDFREQGWELDEKSRKLRKPPLRYYLTYLITAWTRAVEDEHRLLWHTLQTLSRFPVLPESHLQGALQEASTPGMPIYASIARPNGILRSPGEFWSALGNLIKPSLTYAITLPIEQEGVPAGPPVLTTRLRVVPEEQPTEEMMWFSGVVRDEQGQPVPGAYVEFESHGPSTTSDDQGRFRLRVVPGRHVLVARSSGLLQRREIDVPADSYDITLSEHS